MSPAAVRDPGSTGRARGLRARRVAGPGRCAVAAERGRRPAGPLGAPSAAPGCAPESAMFGWLWK